MKVRGAATYAYEHPVERPAYLYPLQATIAAGHLTGVDTSAASAEPGVLAVFTHENAPKLASTDDGDVELGDIIVGIDGAKVGNYDDLYRALDLPSQRF